MANRIVPFYTVATDYTQAQEDTLAATLTGLSIGSQVIYNTTRNKTRIWNGSAFADAPLLDADGGTYSAAPLTTINTGIASYRTLLATAGSHIAGKVAGTYGMGCGDPLAVSGTGTLYPLTVIQIVGADYPTINGLAAKLRIRVQLYTNDVAPTGNFTFGLYPITRPGTSGGAGLCIYTLGTVVSGSNGASFTTPAADLLGSAVSLDFSLPSDGPYVIGVVTTQTVAVSSLVQINAQLQIRNA
jgi:hypothetical protein